MTSVRYSGKTLKTSKINDIIILVRRMVEAKSREYFHSSKQVSVTMLRDNFTKHIEPFVDDVSKFGMHSIKSGAASNPAYGRIPGDLLDIHAGWKCPSLKSRCIKHTEHRWWLFKCVKSTFAVI